MEPNYLALKNCHPKDSDIIFIEKDHEYIVKGKKGFTSVTTYIHTLFPKFDSDLIVSRILNSKKMIDPSYEYYGMNKKQILASWKNSTNLGSKLHYQIELFYNKEPNDIENEISKEWGFFENFAKDHLHLEPFRTEMKIYSESLKISGSIDMLFKRSNGMYDIYDWKRTKNINMGDSSEESSEEEVIRHIKNVNYEHYSLQLNLYRYILEKEYGYKIKQMFLIVLHPKNDNYVKIKVRNLQDEIHGLMLKRLVLSDMS